MKKKILITAMLTLMLVFLFTVCAFASAQGYSTFDVTLTNGTTMTVYTAGVDQWEGRVYLNSKIYAEAPLDTDGTYEEISWSDVKVLDFSNSMLYVYDSNKQAWNERAYGSNQSNTAFCAMVNTLNRSQCTNLEKIITGKIVTVRGATFGQFPALKEIVFSKAVKEIQYNAVERNPLLENVIFEDGGVLTSIGNQAFVACPKLKSISIPNTVTSMGNNVFNGCTSLKSINWSSGLTIIPNATFYGCTSLESFTVSSYITEIGGNAFNGCSSLSNVTIPNGVKKIGAGAFQNCTKFTEIALPASIEYIGSDCWRGCSGVTKITIDPNCSVTHIYAHTFDGTKATEITLPNSVQQIGQSNFNSGTYVTINFGASFVGFQASNGTQPPFALGASLKYMYLSDTFTADSVRNCVFSWNDNKDNEVNINYVGLTFIFTGTYEQAKAIIDAANGDFVVNDDGTTAGARLNTYIGTMQLISASDYAKAVADGTLVEGKKDAPARYLVYGYNKCEAFYNGEHSISTEAVDKFEGEAYVTRYVSVCACTRGCGEDAVNEICGPLFTNKGYSVYEENGKGNIAFGLYIDEKNISDYEAYTGEKVTFGFVVGKENTALDGAIIDENGACLVDGAIVTDFATIDFKSFSIYNLKLSGIKTDANKAQNIYCGAYVLDGTRVSYIGDTVGSKAIAISYNSLFEAKKDEQ